jgi:hypothetical protein
VNILKKIPVIAAITAAGAIMYMWGNIDGQYGRTVFNAAEAATSPLVSPTRARSPLDVYFPNTEDLASDEMRVIAVGPVCRPPAQPKLPLVFS